MKFKKAAIPILLLTGMILFVLFYFSAQTSSGKDEYSSEKFKQFMTYLRGSFSAESDEFVLAKNRTFSDSLLTSLIREKKWEMAGTLINGYKIASEIVILNESGAPVAWTGLTNDLLDAIKAQPKSSYGLVTAFRTVDAVYLGSVKPVSTGKKDETKIVVFKVLGYNNLYYPSTAVPSSLASGFAGRLNLPSVPLVSLSADKPIEKHPIRVFAGTISSDSTFFNFDLTQLNLALENSVRTYLQVLNSGIYLCEFLILFVGIMFLFRINTPRNLLFSSVAAVFFIFYLLNIWFGISSVFFPPNFIDQATYIRQQTYGLFQSFISWMDFSVVFCGLGLLFMSFEFPVNRQRPGKYSLAGWFVLGSILLSVCYIFIGAIIDSLLLDGFVAGLPLDVSIGKPVFWLLISIAAFLTGANLLIWILFKARHLNFLKKTRWFHWLGIILIGMTSFIVVQMAFNPNATSQIFPLSLGFLIFSGTAWYSVYRGLRWKHSTKSFYQYGLIFIQSFVPAFFILLSLNESRLDVLQKNHAVKLTNPNDGWVQYLANNSSDLMKKRLADENFFNKPDENQSGFAYSVWLQSLLSRERLNVRIRIYDSEINLLSEWSFGSIIPVTALEDSLFSDSLLNKIPNKGELSVLLKSENGTTSEISRYAETIKSEQDSVLGFFIFDLVKPKSRSEISRFGLLNNENEDIQSLKFTAALYQSGQIAESSILPMFPAKLDSGLLRKLDWYGQAELERISENKKYLVFFYQNPKDPGKVWAVSRMLNTPVWYWNQFSQYLLILIITLILTYLSLQIISWYKNGKLTFTFRERVFTGVIIASLIPFWLLILFFEQSFQSHAVNTSKLLLENYYRGILPQVINQLTDKQTERAVSEQDYLVYKDRQVLFSTRPEWLKLNLMPDWIPGTNKGSSTNELDAMVEYREFTLNNVEFIVGFYPVPGKVSGSFVLAIPNLLSKQVVEGEIDTARSYLVSGYVVFILFLITFFSAWVNWLLLPIKTIEQAFAKVGRQKDPVFVDIKGVPEMEEFAHSFNSMIEDLNHYKESLAVAERQLAWQEMAKQVAHEIKNPLNPLKLNTQMLISLFQSKNPKFDQVFEKMSKTILNEIETIDRIAKTFATYSRMPERKPEPIDLYLIAEETAGLFRSDEAEIELILAGKRQMVLADKDEISRVFNNLIKNAIQARRLKTIQIVISFDYQSYWAHVSITDNGKGIPESLITKVTEPNFSTKSDGMGLGLSICRKVIQDMRGQLTIKSKEGEWTTVEIQIPVIS
ncbi:MAG: GHKL domain-containing protein [Bacteroidetes bacterium]|nr:GHKL domain-containing protein [Bacteroidota bacterium]